MSDWWWLLTPGELAVIWLYAVIREQADRARLRYVLREWFPPTANTTAPTTTELRRPDWLDEGYSETPPDGTMTP